MHPFRPCLETFNAAIFFCFRPSSSGPPHFTAVTKGREKKQTRDPLASLSLLSAMTDDIDKTNSPSAPQGTHSKFFPMRISLK
jgi:hypothetical protein